MDSVNIHVAKTNLSRLLVRVEAGEEIVIARAGRPVARLVSVRGLGEPRRPGAWRGRVRIASDFDDELPTGMGAAFGSHAR